MLNYDKKSEGSFDKYCRDSMSEWKKENKMFPFDKPVSSDGNLLIQLWACIFSVKTNCNCVPLLS